MEASRIPVCRACLESFQRIEQPFCPCCGRPSAALTVTGAAAAGSGASGHRLCRLCRGGTYAFRLARSFAIYDDALATAVVLLKYEAVRPLGEWFGARLAETVARQAEDLSADAIVPVPLHADRLRERGYNQAEMIARPLARHLRMKLEGYLLARTRPRPPQLVLSRSERWGSVRGAYATRGGAKVDKLRVLLVDDVFTTGATLDACARALRKAGAAEVKGLTVGRVVPEWSPLAACRKDPGTV
jgi:competence protein ComFC